MTSSRLAADGRIDRTRRLDVSFDGQSLNAHPGDTLASALLASGVRVTGHSVILGRPRGIMSAGPEEPSGIVQIEKPFPEPMLTATTVEAVDGLAASSIYGQGRLAQTGDPHIYDAIHHHCEVAVVGAGPAGLSAALTAGRGGARVLLIDSGAEPGGALLTKDEIDWAASIVRELVTLPNVVHLQRTTVTGYYDDNFLIAVQRRTGHDGADAAPDAVRERVWRIRAQRVVLATGAHERPIVFQGNDIPGVMLAESVRVYLQRYGVLAGERVVVFTAHDDAYRVAGELLAVGAEVVVVDPRSPEGSVVVIQRRAHYGQRADRVRCDSNGGGSRRLPDRCSSSWRGRRDPAHTCRSAGRLRRLESGRAAVFAVRRHARIRTADRLLRSGQRAAERDRRRLGEGPAHHSRSGR